MNEETPNSGNNPSPLPPIVAAKPAKKDKKQLILLIVTVVSILLAVGFAVMALSQQSKRKSAERNSAETTTKLNQTTDKLNQATKGLEDYKKSTGESNVDKNQFQSVFLTSGQVYFGKITSISDTQLVLEKVYYLKTASKITDTNNLPGDVSLVKLGNELHAPQDKMYIDRKNVQFWENLKADGEVSKAIVAYEKQNPGQ